jgi:hypothetical protein
MTISKLKTIKFTEAELDVIYDAINELSIMTDDEEVLDLISSISDKMYNKDNGAV